MSLIRINRLIQSIDYSFVVPLTASLPIPVGRKIAIMRGIVCAILDYDWRSNALNFRYVRSRVMENMRNLSSRKPLWGTLKRFVNNSIEEWQSCLFRHPDKMVKIAGQCHIEHLDDYKRHAREKRGIVLVSAHFDSFCMGMVLIGMKGLKVHCINTSGLENPLIDPAIRSYFKIKYSYMESLMNGKMPYHEDGMEIFYEKLNNGEMVVLMGDIPGSRSSVFIDFLGKKFRLPLGAWHMARKTNSLLGAYMTFGFPGGKYHTISIPPYEPDPHDPVKSLMPIYSFMEKLIKAHPEKWVASDLLQGY
ncbi:hypothetical protein MTBBW1_2030033 [Desulfamplus magnetovallimortis]|uniref:Lipid A biosynthesis acyltransferase n=1 Tax=Desulfamplus magnetovallimortis TaxID=1246637 RepID=A0A1W1HBX1_9BACT|nr:lysophospholipid acyltransferase family protein [Desulfamplus magnetovallimortis]SLM29943.1 hypothetical protein MTBBW1_2030033 [Desulfamplus magnetovallimortis]